VAGERPATKWLDDDERGAWLSLLRVMSKLPPLLDAQLDRDAGLTLFEYTILAMLSEQSDATLRMSRLASVTNASPSKLSHAARHLEVRGYLVRGPDPDDGRCVRAVLTAAGRALVEASAPAHVTAVRQLFLDPLTRAQVQALREANQLILQRVDPDEVTDPSASPTPSSPPRPAAGPSPTAPPTTREDLR
jgi:DNA-binding MarR family transcriptional regulator